MRASRPERPIAASLAVSVGTQCQVWPAKGAAVRRAGCPQRNTRTVGGEPTRVRPRWAAAPPARLWTAGRPCVTRARLGPQNWALVLTLAGTPSSACRSNICQRRSCCHPNSPARPASTCRSFHRCRSPAPLSLPKTIIYPKNGNCYYLLSLFVPYLCCFLFSMKHKRNVVGRSGHMAQHDSCENMTWEKGRTVWKMAYIWGCFSQKGTKHSHRSRTILPWCSLEGKGSHAGLEWHE